LTNEVEKHIKSISKFKKNSTANITNMAIKLSYNAVECFT